MVFERTNLRFQKKEIRRGKDRGISGNHRVSKRLSDRGCFLVYFKIRFDDRIIGDWGSVRLLNEGKQESPRVGVRIVRQHFHTAVGKTWRTLGPSDQGFFCQEWRKRQTLLALVDFEGKISKQGLVTSGRPLLIPKGLPALASSWRNQERPLPSRSGCHASAVVFLAAFRHPDGSRHLFAKQPRAQ